MVSIPSSSGHQFTGLRHLFLPPFRGMRFNPFFIRASVYCGATGCFGARCTPFQSLLHQGISLLDFRLARRKREYALVSIPSSSGHQFTDVQAGNPPLRVQALFQSLLHQGISLLQFERRRRVLVHLEFQSLLHQGISLLHTSAFIVDPKLVPFQSLLHQGISLLHQSVRGVFLNVISVSIPSSSGHQFTGILCLEPDSDIGNGFNPFFIRASVYCFSECHLWLEGKLVSIPSSSGHQFTEPAAPRTPTGILLRFNPFFIRASVYCVRKGGTRQEVIDVSIPSSSGHQFTGDH